MIGTPHQQGMLKSISIPNRYLLTPLVIHGQLHSTSAIESELHELPIASGSIDLVVLPHILECVDNPRQLLSEACRVIKPQGYIIIFGFNPHSLWGLKQSWMRHEHAPWSGNFIKASAIRQWLGYADFELLQSKTFLFRPPVKHERTFQNLQFLEWVGRLLHSPIGGIYTLVAQAKVVPLTPIKLSWQQKLSDVKLSASIGGIPKPTVRNHLR